MEMDRTKNELEIDEEWVQLIVEAVELGIPIEEIRQFLSKPQENIA